MPKKLSVTYYIRETVEYEVEGKDYDEAFQNAVEQKYDHEVNESESYFDVEEMED